MKSCKFCNSNYANELDRCLSCGAGEYNNVCQNCKTVFDTRFCPNCGKSPNEIMRDCPRCGNKTTDLFCSKCGTNLANNAPGQAFGNTQSNPVQIIHNTYVQQTAPDHPGKPRSKWVAFTLCILWGYFGAHKFYEGKAGMGILYLFTVGLFCIGWLVDCIALLCKPNPYYV